MVSIPPRLLSQARFYQIPFTFPTPGTSCVPPPPRGLPRAQTDPHPPFSCCQITTRFAPGDFQGFALVNPQRNSRLTAGFTVEPVTEGTQLSFGNFAHLGHESFYWQLPETFQGDKVGRPAGPGRPPSPITSSEPGPGQQGLRHELASEQCGLAGRRRPRRGCCLWGSDRPPPSPATSQLAAW